MLAPPPPTARPAPTPSRAPSISVSDPAPAPHEYVQVHGQGFDPRQRYVIFFQQHGRRWQVQSPASPRRDGSYARSVQVPGFAQPGSAQLVSCVYRVRGGLTNRCARQRLTINFDRGKADGREPDGERHG